MDKVHQREACRRVGRVVEKGGKSTCGSIEEQAGGVAFIEQPVIVRKGTLLLLLLLDAVHAGRGPGRPHGSRHCQSDRHRCVAFGGIFEGPS